MINKIYIYIYIYTYIIYNFSTQKSRRYTQRQPTLRLLHALKIEGEWLSEFKPVKEEEVQRLITSSLDSALLTLCPLFF